MATIMKPLELTLEEWAEIHLKLSKMFMHKPSVIIMREVMKRELGFTTRRHRYYVKDPVMYMWELEEKIMIDFYTPESESWFRLNFL